MPDRGYDGGNQRVPHGAIGVAIQTTGAPCVDVLVDASRQFDTVIRQQDECDAEEAW